MTNWTMIRQLSLLALAIALGGCGASTVESDGDRSVEERPTTTTEPEPAAEPTPEPPAEDPPEPSEPTVINDDSCLRPVPIYEEGERRGQVCPDNAGRHGLTIVDLSDDWVPVIFSESEEHGELGRQPYRSTYLALADERFDEVDGGRRSEQYLELYGIFPTFRVLRQRLSEQERHQCHDQVDDEPLGELTEDLPPLPRQSRTQRRSVRHMRYLKQRLERELEQRELTSFEELTDQPRLKRLVSRYQRGRQQLEAVTALQQHLICDGELREEADDGLFDYRTLRALRHWQRRHMIVSRGELDADSRRVLQLDSREADFHSLLRALRERVVDASGLIEDGSARHEWGTILGRTIEAESFRFTAGHAAAPNGAPDLISPATEAAARALGWTSPEAALSFLEELGDDGTERFRVALRLPDPPRYHSSHMDLRAEIDRGDVYYELGNRWRHPERRPILTLYARDGGREVALMRWGTTIGGWQPENTEDGGIGLRYKNSPPGERIWRDIIASPAWLPPPSTPNDELVVQRGERWVPKRSLFGPGYRSAYGLVMMMHAKVLDSVDEEGNPRLFDEGIRSHGSVSYRSILGGFSHGCHRLYNHLAVRLASFLLHHRDHVRRGSITVDFHREVEMEGEDVSFAITSRGYQFELTPPVRIEVLEGNIRGPLDRPIMSFRNVRYPEEEEEGEEGEGGEGSDGGEGGGEATAPATGAPEAPQQL